MKNKKITLIIKHKDGVILQKRTADYSLSNQWTMFGGSVEDGETSEEAAKRELKEELGIELELTNIGDYTFEYTPPQTSPMFIGELNDLSLITLGEGSGFAVFHKDELHKIKSIPMRKVLKEAMKW